MRTIFKVLLSGIVMGVFFPITVSYYNPLLLMAGVVVGIVFGLIFYALRSKLPTENLIVKSLVLGLFLLFLPTYAIVSFFETMFIFPPEVVNLSSLFYVKSSSLFAILISVPSLVFGIVYRIVSTEKVENYIDNF